MKYARENGMAKSKVELGTDYERFVHAVYQRLVNAEGVENVTVSHNVQLEGKSGCRHQIDVYWEFRLAGQLYQTAIECKAFKNGVPLGRVRDFQGVLHDLPGVKGLFATSGRYHKGALVYAKQCGISLLEVRRPTDADWDGRVRTIRHNIHVVIPDITAFVLRPSPAFLALIPEGTELVLDTSFSNYDTIIFDGTGEPVASYEDMRHALPFDRKGGVGFTHFAAFPGHVFRTDRASIDIDGVDITYDVTVHTETKVIEGDDIVHAIIKDVASGGLTVVDKDECVRQP